MWLLTGLALFLQPGCFPLALPIQVPPEPFKDHLSTRVTSDRPQKQATGKADWRTLATNICMIC